MTIFRYKLIFFCCLLASLSLPACSQVSKRQNNDIAGNYDVLRLVTISQQSELVFDTAELTNFFKKYRYIVPYERDIRSFYHKRHYAYAWFEPRGIIEQVASLSNRLLNLEAEGVYSHFPYQAKLDSLLDQQIVKTTKETKNLDLELLLTSAYFMYANLVWQGMDNAVSKSVDWFIPRKKISYDQYLDSILKAPTGELSDEPVYRQYELLRAHLKEYRLLDGMDLWKPLLDRKKVKLGDTSPFVQKVKSRLYKLGDFHNDTTDNLFDQHLEDAIKSFQERNGLPANGLIDQQTLREINTPLKIRIKQILVNMERSRWLPTAVAGDHVAVNIPEFKLHVYHADSLLWSCNAVVGQTIHPTTQFYGEIQYVVFSPYWNIPPGILRKEILPAIRKNPNYLANHNMEITGYQQGLPIIRQRPGPSNPLGLIKFLFPNSYNIYLHDTPSKNLFNESSRAFSHGCIRISEPEKFAAFLLKNMDGWSSAKITHSMHSGKEKYITLKEPVPVFIAYFTAFIDRSNRLNFRKDIYGLDDRLAEMIVAVSDDE